MAHPFTLRLWRGFIAGLLLLLGLSSVASAQVGVINGTTTNTTSTTQHETDIPITLPTITINGNGVVNSQQLLKKIVNSPDQTVIGWSLHKPLTDPKVQVALKTALAVLEQQKSKFPSGARLLFKGRSTALSGSGATSSTSVSHDSLGTTTSITNSTTIGPGTILIGNDQSQQFFVAAGNTNINTNTHTEDFFENDSQTTITLGGQTRSTTQTSILARTIFIDLDAVYSTLFSGLPVALAQRESLVNAHAGGIGDVNGRIFRAWLGLNDSEVPQGDGLLGDDVRCFLSGNVGWLSQSGGDTTAGLDDTRESASTGAEWKINPALRLGFAVNYVHSDTDFSGDLGSQHIDGGALSVYATWRQPNWYADLLYSAGLFDDTTNRNTLLGRTAHSSANDWSQLVSLNIGYIFKVSDTMITGPYASLTYVHGRLDASTEHGGGSAALSYGPQSYDSLVSNVGWQANWKLRKSWGSITPLVHIGWERENLSDAGDVNATLLQSPFALLGVGRFGGFGVSTHRESARYDALNIGAAVSFDVGERWTLNLGVNEVTDFGPRNDFSIGARAELRF